MESPCSVPVIYIGGNIKNDIKGYYNHNKSLFYALKNSKQKVFSSILSHVLVN